MDVDSDFNSNSDLDGYDKAFYKYPGKPTFANEVIDKIGIKVPPPILGDAYDDYHGRGHDMFVGPRAQADEWVLS